MSPEDESPDGLEKEEKVIEIEKYSKQKNYSEVIKEGKKALKIKGEVDINDERNMSLDMIINLQVGVASLQTGDSDPTEYLSQAQDLAKKLNEHLIVAQTHLSMGRYFSKQTDKENNLEEARKEYEAGLKSLEEIGEDEQNEHHIKTKELLEEQRDACDEQITCISVIRDVVKDIF